MSETPNSEKHGINLGCGRILLPRAKPLHYGLIPDDLFEDRTITWDNADIAALPGVNIVVDLFRYPWVDLKTWNAQFDTTGNSNIPENTYDVALAAHVVEHIPHMVLGFNGQVKSAGGGWWAWWNELGRILKPDGVVWVLVPYGTSRGGMMDPTHTRLVMPETFGYLAPDPNAPFEYPLTYRFKVVYGPMLGITDMAQTMTKRETLTETPEAFHALSHLYLNMIAEFVIGLQVCK